MQRADSRVGAAVSPLKLTPLDNPDTLRYFLAGGIAASISHGVAVPFDVVKTKIQQDPVLYPKSMDLLASAQKIVEREGLAILITGMGPTLAGYCIQGSLKYGFYELFKPILLQSFPLFESERLLLFITAGAFAELIGSSTLTPFEAARIRLVANPSYASGVQGMYCLDMCRILLYLIFHTLIFQIFHYRHDCKDRC